MTRSRAEAEDLCQDVFLRAFRALARFGRRLPFAPWLRRIASNASLNHLRDRGLERSLVAPEGAGERDSSAPDTRPDPEEAARAAETADRLGRALARLPVSQR